ncbi:MAG: phosphatidate cytidylyltransferase [Enterobacteriaceae bacterium]
MLKYRIITTLIMVPLVIAALFKLSLFQFALVAILVCGVAAWEWGRLAGVQSQSIRISLALVLALALFLMWRGAHLAPGELPTGATRGWLWLSLAWWLIALVLVLFYPGSSHWWRNSRVIRLLFGIVTLIPFFWGMIALRNMSDYYDPHLGAWWLLYVMVLVWGADTGAYVFGKLFGRNKLMPKISPGKTWEGLLGGLFTSAMIALLFSYVVTRYHVSLSVIPMTLLVCSVVAVAASVLGDLTESMLKREAGLKDSSQLIPGHGGVLDRIDSLTAAIPVFACLMLLLFGA